MLNLLNKVIFTLVILSIIFGIISILVALRIIFTHREKIYQEKLKRFNNQFNRVQKNLKKRRKNND